MQIKDIMTHQVISIAPEETVAVAARQLARHNIGALPVCSSDGRLKGMLTDRDIVLRCIAADQDPNTQRVSDIMSRRVVSVKPEDMAKTASDLMSAEQVRRLPVEQDGRVIGMVALGDLAVKADCSIEASAALSEICLNVKRK